MNYVADNLITIAVIGAIVYWIWAKNKDKKLFNIGGNNE